MASDQTFWDSPSLEDLERLQGVQPVYEVVELFGTWPGDDDDGFEEAIDALRHPGGAMTEAPRTVSHGR